MQVPGGRRTGDDRRRRRAWASWSVLLCGGLLVVLAQAVAAQEGGEGGEATGDAEGGVTQEALLEASTYYSAQCAQCHGGDGQGAAISGTDRVGPPLAGTDRVTVPYVDLVLRVGRMPPPGDPFDNRPRHVRVDDAQRRALVAWMAQQFDLEGEVPEVGEGDAARGREVYATNCAQCHGSTGVGGVAGGGTWTPQINRYEPVTIAEAIRVGPFNMPAFDEAQISDEEVADIAAFLGEVESEEGTLLGLFELNPVYASLAVALVVVALLLSLGWIAGRPIPLPSGTLAPRQEDGPREEEG